MVLSVIRYSFGFGRKRARLSLGFLSGLTGKDRSEMSKVVKRLIEKKVLDQAKEDGLPGEGRAYTLNKHYHLWGVEESSTPKRELRKAQPRGGRLRKAQQKSWGKLNPLVEESSTQMARSPGRERASSNPKKGSQRKIKEKEGRAEKARLNDAEKDRKKREFVKFKAGAFEAYKVKFRKKPAWGGAEYRSLQTALEKLDYDVPEAIKRWSVFLEDPDPFYKGHDPKKFASNPDRWVENADPTEPYYGERT